MTWSSTLDAIVKEAKSLSPTKVAVTVVTVPLFVIGWIVGLVYSCVTLLWAAGVVGFREAKKTASRPPRGD